MMTGGNASGVQREVDSLKEFVIFDQLNPWARELLAHAPFNYSAEEFVELWSRMRQAGYPPAQAQSWITRRLCAPTKQEIVDGWGTKWGPRHPEYAKALAW